MAALFTLLGFVHSTLVSILNSGTRNSLLRFPNSPTLAPTRRAGIPVLDPFQDLRICDNRIVEALRQVELLEERLFSHPLHLPLAQQLPGLLKLATAAPISRVSTSGGAEFDADHDGDQDKSGGNSSCNQVLSELRTAVRRLAQAERELLLLEVRTSNGAADPDEETGVSELDDFSSGSSSPPSSSASESDLGLGLPADLAQLRALLGMQTVLLEMGFIEPAADQHHTRPPREASLGADRAMRDHFGAGGEGGGDARLSLRANTLHTLTRKGRFASAVRNADALVGTELAFQGVLGGLSSPELAALLSCLVCNHRSDRPTQLLQPRSAEDNSKGSGQAVTAVSDSDPVDRRMSSGQPPAKRRRQAVAGGSGLQQQQPSRPLDSADGAAGDVSTTSPPSVPAPESSAPASAHRVFDAFAELRRIAGSLAGLMHRHGVLGAAIRRGDTPAVDLEVGDAPSEDAEDPLGNNSPNTDLQEARPEQFEELFQPSLMDAVFTWTSRPSSTFAQVCALTTLQEGIVVKCFRHLQELLLQVGWSTSRSVRCQSVHSRHHLRVQSQSGGASCVVGCG